MFNECSTLLKKFIRFERLVILENQCAINKQNQFRASKGSYILIKVMVNWFFLNLYNLIYLCLTVVSIKNDTHINFWHNLRNRMTLCFRQYRLNKSSKYSSFYYPVWKNTIPLCTNEFYRFCSRNKITIERKLNILCKILNISKERKSIKSVPGIYGLFGIGLSLSLHTYSPSYIIAYILCILAATIPFPTSWATQK